MAQLKDTVILGDLSVTGTIYGNLTGNATTATTSSYPAGFSNRSTNQTWGNQTGTTVTGWNEVNGGSVDWRRDNPSSGKISLKVDGRFYGQEGTYPTMLMRNENGYWGLCDPDAANNVWIRTTSQGIIPYQSGGSTSGNSYLGTSSWYFYQAYIQTIYSNQTFGAVWNDYAEYRELRENQEIPYGRIVIENGDDTLSLSTERLQPGGHVVSDTFGFAIGETDKCKLPIAVSGRALVYTYEDRNTYKPGDAVCTGPEGTVSKMSREEIKEYPERIIGTVSAVPDYKNWGTGNVAVDGRIWIYIK